ncbi:lipopolysaccharide biosynthesis protein [Pseudidiomarina sp. CB1]|uniref:lipopolysaccharide biosynthesis protein n=1 Tax=Pseudidiomarina sp. CB1 TaxID=2972484 RepID=UPI0021636963|nr:oligosaccharide flippase family protein [Pseudidiomarina sp. CB1]
MSFKNTSRLVKNVGFLYTRMLITMGVSLYTSRVVLDVLGVEDFGIYHVVAGFVAMLGFVLSAMSTSTTRFLSHAMGKKNPEAVNSTFLMSLNIHVLIALGVLFVAETLGISFVASELTIPDERMDAALFVYHFAVLSFLVTIVMVPFNALIIAHEHMRVYAWVSILDASLKLAAVLLLGKLGFDVLQSYGVLMALVAALVAAVYISYCLRKFSAAKLRIHWNTALFKELFSHSSWTMWGTLAGVAASQGVNILLNIFFGPALNAARTIAAQVGHALSSFVMNLQQAINPQLMKSYSSGDLDYTTALMFNGSRYNFFLITLLAFPVLFNTQAILEVWLVNVPEYATVFVQLLLVNIIIDSTCKPLMAVSQATGRIRLYQFMVAGVQLLNLPMVYVAFSYGYPPQSAFWVLIGLSIVAMFVRIIMLRRIFVYSISSYFLKVLFPCVMLGSIGGAGMVFILYVLGENLLVNLVTILLLYSLFLILFGLTRAERNFIVGKSKLVMRRLLRHN